MRRTLCLLALFATSFTACRSPRRETTDAVGTRRQQPESATEPDTAPPLPIDSAVGDTAHLQAAGASLAGARLLIPPESLLSILGPASSDVSEMDMMYDSIRTIEYPTARAWFIVGAGLQSIECWGPGCEYAGTVRIGSTVRQVVQSLGRATHSPDANTIVYMLHRCDCWLVIEFDTEGRVRRMALELDNT